ncbi:MAG: nitrogenase [Syntrophobacteraceae bacterium]|nr:nitrogenase [Syntrophobacteraceae bacterium]
MCNHQPVSCNTVQPDGLTGAILALEGIEDAAVILHGPTGCRGHHCSLSERAFPRDIPDERLNFFEPFYFGQPRIPATGLDGDDFVFGAAEKLRKALATVAARGPALIAVINTPGAALIGEDLRRIAFDSGIAVPVAGIDMPALSRSMAEGYEQAIAAVLDTLDLNPACRRRPKTVTLLGLSIAHHHWAGSIEEIRRLLALSRIEVVCAPGAGSPVGAWKRIPEAACHVAVHAEYGEQLAWRLAERFGGTAVVPRCGAPFGFTATEEWLREVAEAAGADPAPALAAVKAVRRRVACVLSRITTLTGAPKGLTCSIQADASTALPLVRFLYEYLGILPVSVEIPDEAQANSHWAARLGLALTRMGCADAWQTPWQNARADFLLADGCRAVQGPIFGIPADCCIELVLPMSGCVDLTPKALLGAEGTALLVEKIVNAVSGML